MPDLRPRQWDRASFAANRMKPFASFGARLPFLDVQAGAQDQLTIRSARGRRLIQFEDEIPVSAIRIGRDAAPAEEDANLVAVLCIEALHVIELDSELETVAVRIGQRDHRTAAGWRRVNLILRT